MAVQGILWLAKRYPSTLISIFLIGFRYFSYLVATQLASPPEKFLGYNRESNPGPLGWQSDIITSIPRGGRDRQIVL